jgi:hypothetical protein
MEEKLYAIDQEFTDGWKRKFSSLTRKQAEEKYNFLLSRGTSPDRIKIVRIK